MLTQCGGDPGKCWLALLLAPPHPPVITTQTPLLALWAEQEHSNGYHESSRQRPSRARPARSPRTCRGGPSPAGGTRCSGSCPRAQGGCWCSRRHTGVSASGCRTRGLEGTRAAGVSSVPRAVPAPARRLLQAGQCPARRESLRRLEKSSKFTRPCPRQARRTGPTAEARPRRWAGHFPGSRAAQGPSSEGRRCAAHSMNRRLALGSCPKPRPGLCRLPGQDVLSL